MTRHRTRPVAVVLRHGRGCPRAVRPGRASSVDPEPEVWGRPISSSRIAPEKPRHARGLDPISTPKTGCGFTPSDGVGKRDIGCTTGLQKPGQNMRDLMHGPLVAELCAGLDHIRGRFPKVLWLGGSL